MLDEVGLAAAAEQPVGTFSLGMRQRLAIAAALLHRPALVLLDEPVNGLDPTATAWLRGLVRSWSATGTAFIVASHLLDELDRTAQRVVVLRRGAVVADAPVGELAGRGLRRSTSVVVHTDQPAVVRTALEAGGLRAMQTTPTMVRVDAPGVASVAAALSACDAAVDQIVLDRPTLAEAVDRTLAEP
jgi:ABC-2 type transport system ATP-binding protein